MFCTKCGVWLPADTQVCPNCAAPVFKAASSGPVRRKPRRLVLPAAFVLACTALVLLAWWKEWFRSAASGLPTVNVGLVEIAHSIRPHTWNAGTAASATADMLLLPKVDTEFVGTWGGHVHVQSTSSNAGNILMHDVPMSYYFGERNGVVFLRTDVYGDQKWPVAKTGVKVLSPTSIEFRIDSTCQTCSPPMRQQEITRLTLVNGRQLQAECYTYAYVSGDGHIDLTYKGMLHPLTSKQLSAIDQEVERNGKLLTKINSKVTLH